MVNYMIENVVDCKNVWFVDSSGSNNMIGLVMPEMWKSQDMLKHVMILHFISII